MLYTSQYLNAVWSTSLHTGLSFLFLSFPPSLMCTEVDTEGTVPPDDDPPQDMGDPDKEVGSCTYTHTQSHTHTTHTHHTHHAHTPHTHTTTHHAHTPHTHKHNTTHNTHTHTHTKTHMHTHTHMHTQHTRTHTHTHTQHTHAHTQHTRTQTVFEYYFDSAEENLIANCPLSEA